MRDEEDAELVARAVADRTAFEPLYKRYVGSVYGYCYRRLGAREAAEDATHQIFVHALAAYFRFALPPFQPEEPPVDNWQTSPWMQR